MKLFDFYQEKMNIQVTKDEWGNLYIEGNRNDLEDLAGICGASSLMDVVDYYFITREEYERINQFEIRIDESIDMEYWFGREPFYRLRGKPVTEKQAFDIIRRTDWLFGFFSDIFDHKDYIRSIYFHNYWIPSPDIDIFASCGGWIHRDGLIGCSAYIYKNPRVECIIEDWVRNLVAFPYLDLIIAITSEWEWGRQTKKMIEKLKMQQLKEEIIESKDFDQAFYDSVCLGIWIHDKTVEVLRSEDTLTVYKKYASLYGKYMIRQIKKEKAMPLDLPYLKRCIQAYGLDPDRVLKEIRKN